MCVKSGYWLVRWMDIVRFPNWYHIGSRLTPIVLGLLIISQNSTTPIIYPRNPKHALNRAPVMTLCFVYSHSLRHRQKVPPVSFPESLSSYSPRILSCTHILPAKLVLDMSYNPCSTYYRQNEVMMKFQARWSGCLDMMNLNSLCKFWLTELMLGKRFVLYTQTQFPCHYKIAAPSPQTLRRFWRLCHSWSIQTCVKLSVAFHSIDSSLETLEETFSENNVRRRMQKQLKAHAERPLFTGSSVSIVTLVAAFLWFSFTGIYSRDSSTCVFVEVEWRRARKHGFSIW